MTAVRRATTQDISWFFDLHANGQLDLNPDYQRKSVWTMKDRRFFLDTVFRGYPSPAIFLHKIMEKGRAVYAVVDGKQRLETIINFTQDKISIDRDYGDARLAGKKWRDIKDSPDLGRAFWDYVLPVEFIDVAESGSEVNEVFSRLNRNSRKLVEQELRHARYDGWFIDFVEHEVEDNQLWWDIKVSTRARAKRMKDVQFVSELMIVLLKGDVSGFDQDELNEYYAEYNDPNECVDAFDEEAVRTRFREARDYLACLENCNNIVSTYAGDAKDLYTLWSHIVLCREQLPTPEVFSMRYKQFMNEVSQYKESENQGLSSEFKSSFPEGTVGSYCRNSMGASTEAPQRRARHDALLQAMRTENGA